MSERPIIRHCMNCEWGTVYFCNEVKCMVKYKNYTCDKQRRKAIFCKYFTPKKEDK